MPSYTVPTRLAPRSIWMHGQRNEGYTSEKELRPGGHELRGSMSVPAFDTRSLSAYGLHNGYTLVGARHHLSPSAVDLKIFKKIVPSRRLYRDIRASNSDNETSTMQVINHKNSTILSRPCTWCAVPLSKGFVCTVTVPSSL